MKTLFQEKQKFTQWWLWLLLIGLTLIPVYGIIKQIVLGDPWGDNPLSDFGLVLYLIFTLALVGFIGILELKTEISEETINVKFFPLTQKTIRWRDVKTAEVVNYGFVGGWGIRIGTRYGTVYNTSGNMGLALSMVNGKKYCIGTQRPDELEDLLKEMGQYVPRG